MLGKLLVLEGVRNCHFKEKSEIHFFLSSVVPLSVVDLYVNVSQVDTSEHSETGAMGLVNCIVWLFTGWNVWITTHIDKPQPVF